MRTACLASLLFWPLACCRSSPDGSEAGLPDGSPVAASAHRLFVPGASYLENQTEGPWLAIDNQGVRVSDGGFDFAEPGLAAWLRDARKKAPGDLSALQLDIDREAFWVRVARVMVLAREAGWKRLAVLYDTDAGRYPPGKAGKPPALPVRLAEGAGEGTFGVQLPEMLPWQAAFFKLQHAVFTGLPLVIDVQRANRDLPTIPERPR